MAAAYIPTGVHLLPFKRYANWCNSPEVKKKLRGFPLRLPITTPAALALAAMRPGARGGRRRDLHDDRVQSCPPGGLRSGKRCVQGHVVPQCATSEVLPVGRLQKPTKTNKIN